MNGNLELGFLWHMHQPDYRDKDGVMRMPWVFLHAIKDYYDMPWMLSQFPSLKASFNITPPLIEQLNLYKEPLQNDYFLQLWYLDPSKLALDDREWLIKTCKSANYEKMVKPNPYYVELYHKEKFTDKEIIDIEVLFILAWCGEYLRLHNPLVQKLLAQKKDYTLNDKKSLFKVTIEFVALILPFYKSLLEEGQIALSTTPYNHPILPLLIDMNNITKANPQSSKPENTLSLYDDALQQVSRAKNLYKETFGRDPIGFWPAEGAVDEASVAIYKKFGIQWIATDEAILFNSIKSQDHFDLYQPYQRDGLKIYFRDHGLSDLFGFDYRFKEAHLAVEHFMHSLKEIASKKGNTKKSLFVILDGENAWEYYDRNAYTFFMKLYQELSDSSCCDTIILDTIASREDVTKLDHLASGSWIYGDFTTWSGHPEKNRAWELIFDTKRVYLSIEEEQLDAKTKKEIEFHFLAAECSDWFWWYGDGHTTSFAIEFDALFRDHLISIYKLLKVTPPPHLLLPIIEDEDAVPFLRLPTALISPDIRKENFFDWVGAGVVEEQLIFSTMDKVRGPLEKILFGFDREYIYIHLQGNIKEIEGDQLIISSASLQQELLFWLIPEENNSSIFINKNIQIALPQKLFSSKGEINLSFEIKKENKIIQTLPGYGLLEIDIAKEYKYNWFI